MFARTTAPRSRSSFHNMARKKPRAKSSKQTQPHQAHPPRESQEEHLQCVPSAEAANSQSVDSWRSYRNDKTNLQSAMGGQSAFNPTANSFVPNNSYSQPSHFIPYQPLRFSNGAKERHIVQSNRHFSNPGYDFSGYNANRYGSSDIAQNASVHQSRWATSNDPTQPIPSIEASDTNIVASNQLKWRRQGYLHESTPRRSPTVSPPPTPEATKSYKHQANKPPKLLESPRKLLVILDLNGTLLYRPNRSNNPTGINMRPGVTNLLQYLFENHVVMIYTSARPDNATGMVNNFMHPDYRRQLAAVWARDKLDLTPAQYYGKVQVYKKLDKIWNDVSIQKTAAKGQKWDQTNTVLVDDSKLKALAQPHNLLQVTEYSKIDNPLSPRLSTPEAQTLASKIQQDILKQLELKLEVLKWQEDVSRLIRKWQTGETPVPRVPGQQVVVEETVDQKVLQELKEKADKSQQRAEQLKLEQSQLLTPQSPSDGEVDQEYKVDADTGTDATQHKSTGTAYINVKSGVGHQNPADQIPGLGQLDRMSLADGPNGSHLATGGVRPGVSVQPKSISPVDPEVWRELLHGAHDKSEKT